MEYHYTVDIGLITTLYDKIYRTSIFYRADKNYELYGDTELREDTDNY